MSSKPKRASDPRPNDEPAYIDSECPNCGTELVLNDKLKDREEIWHDEWTCPDCEDAGIFLDWPDEAAEEVFEERAEEDLVPLEEVELDE